MKKWSYALSIDALVFGCFYLWQVKGIPAAHSFLAFLLWANAVLFVIAGVFMSEVKRGKRPGIFHVYAHVTTVATIGLMVWTNMTALAITFFIGWLLIQGKIKDKPEAANGTD